jgi:hypothetical protein
MTKDRLNQLVDSVIVYGEECPELSTGDRKFIIDSIDDEYADTSKVDSKFLSDKELLRNLYLSWSAWYQCNL